MISAVIEKYVNGTPPLPTFNLVVNLRMVNGGISFYHFPRSYMADQIRFVNTNTYGLVVLLGPLICFSPFCKPYWISISIGSTEKF